VSQSTAELVETNARLLELNRSLEQAHNQLLQSEKMASIGLLAAGVAHEINNPIGYVSSNLTTLQSYIQDLFLLLDAYDEACAGVSAECRPPGIAELKARIDVPFLKEDTLSLIRESHQGVQRVKKIIGDLKAFSRSSDEDEWAPADLHAGLESTLNVIWNELKYTCEVKKEYGELPAVECVLSQLNQVFMNLLVNAAQAIGKKGTITIRTGAAGDEVWVEVSDTGCGIPADRLKRIFEPFYTTKPVGKGTGLGLSVSYSIVQRHHGRIDVQSEVGKGTTFRVTVPQRQAPNNGEPT
jgi:signal transduction histidine kinase